MSSIREDRSQTRSEWRPGQGLLLCFVPEGKVSSFFRAQKKSLFGGDRKKHPNRAAVFLGSLLAPHVGDARGKTDAKYMKTCARQSDLWLSLSI